MSELQLENVTKSYGGLTVIPDLSLSVEQGERVAVIGPNGAGKTTLLSMITGARMPSGGRITLFGKDITHMPPYQRLSMGLACSFQLNHLFFGLSVLDNIYLALLGAQPGQRRLLRPVSSDLDDRAYQLLTSVDLWEKRHDPVGVLSYGDQRKLEILFGLASSPRLLVLDEPTAGLALAEIDPFMRTINSLSQGTTILFTSHDMDVVFGLATRLVVLFFGLIIASGTPDQIRADERVREIYLGEH
ncbi:MAG: ABC transporter ATP-binding protein [Anaerolineae bacterium]